MSKILFLDESGDHSLSKIDLEYPVFVLGGVIVEHEYAYGEMTQRVNDFKHRLFGRADFSLHTAEIIRNKGVFKLMMDLNFRKLFYQELNCLMRSLQYTAVACVIHKDKHLARYGMAALDPYLMSLDILIERFSFERSKDSKGTIIAEKRDDTLNRQLMLAWKNLRIQGTRYLNAASVCKKFSGLYLHDKKENIAGLQMADLVVSPIGRHAIGKPEKEDFQIIRNKLRKNKFGVHDGYGLVILPK